VYILGLPRISSNLADRQTNKPTNKQTEAKRNLFGVPLYCIFIDFLSYVDSYVLEIKFSDVENAQLL